MLIPKGHTEGYPCRLFVMISDYEKDEVKQEVGGVCSKSMIFCGLRDRKYPDARAMGYPFDRAGDFAVSSFEDFVRDRNNMLSREILIQHTDEILKYLSIKNLTVNGDENGAGADNSPAPIPSVNAPPAPEQAPAPAPPAASPP